jgi:2-polyprenyl-6-hydroxyphenyl methylase/3-demethylubiquinone-9 3-methyltransferase
MATINLDPKELEKFAALAPHWWDPQGACKPLHDLNPTRLKFITDRVFLTGTRVLDIGCGGGILTESMAKRGAAVTGLDISKELLEIGKLHALEQNIFNIRYEQGTAESFAEEHGAEFDVITCMELLEHVPCPISLIRAAAKLVKPNGHLFFSTLNRTPKAYLFAIVGAEYLLKLLPKRTHQYENFIRPSELEEWLRTANLELKALSGLRYNPFTGTAKLHPDVSVNYLAYARTDV